MSGHMIPHMTHRDTLKGATADSISRGDRLLSRNLAFELIMQSDGNLILYYRKDLKPVWASNSSGSGGETAVMQGDGNFVIYATGARPVFSTNTHGNSGSRVVLENDGNLVIYDRQNKAIWATNTAGKSPSNEKDTLLPGEKLLPGEALRSRNGKVELLLQEDGNLVLHRTHNNTPLWSTNTAGLPIRDCAMQQDGNFVMYDKQGRTVFTTNTYGKHGATLKVRDDGNLCLYQAGQCHWSTNTNPGPPRVPRFPRPQAQPKTAGIRF